MIKGMLLSYLESNSYTLLEKGTAIHLLVKALGLTQDFSS